MWLMKLLKPKDLRRGFLRGYGRGYAIACQDCRLVLAKIRSRRVNTPIEFQERFSPNQSHGGLDKQSKLSSKWIETSSSLGGGTKYGWLLLSCLQGTFSYVAKLS